MYSRSRAHAGPGATAHSEMKPMTPLTYAAVVAGTHMMMFWGIICMAWGAEDRLGAIIITGLMTALGIWNFFKFRNRFTGPVYIFQIASCAAVMLAAFNLRFDTWIAHGYGISVAELHQRMPVWLVPVLTLVLVLWTVFMLAITKPNGTAAASAA